MNVQYEDKIRNNSIPKTSMLRPLQNFLPYKFKVLSKTDQLNYFQSFNRVDAWIICIICIHYGEDFTQ